MKKHWLLIPAILPSIIAPITSCSQNNKKYDFKQMYTDYKSMLFTAIETSTVDSFKNKTIDDGEGNLKFDDIDYTNEDRANWPAHQHVLRALKMAVASQKNNDEDLFNKSIKLAKHWLKHDTVDYKNSNWWFMEIGVPRDLSDLAMFIFDKLTQPEQDKLIEIIRRGSLLHNKTIPDGRKTGTNLFWFADISMKDAWLTNDRQEFDLMFNLVNKEIRENENDGFQSDGSYYQHDHQLYNGGYGRQGAILLAKIMAAFSNVEYEWPTDKLEIIVNFILNGLATTIHKGYTDYGMMGRTYCRKEANQIDGGTTDLGNVTLLKYIAKLPNCPHKQEVEDVINAWEHNQSSFSGVRVMKNSSFISMNIDDVYISFKGTNATLRNSEKGNGENMLGYNLSYGTSTCVMQTGKEYFDITPVWNYSFIPGTTALDLTDIQLDEWFDNTEFRRQLEEGIYNCDTIDGVTFAMQSTKHETIHYTVTCFATEDGMVLVGSDLKQLAGGSLHTTVEQCICEEDPTVSNGNQTITNGNVIYSNLIQDQSFEYEWKQKSGNWNRNNRSFSKDDIAEANVLTIKVNNTNDSGRYAYSIQPTTRQQNKFIVVKCSDTIHAIKLPNGKLAAAFYADDSFEYETKTYSGKKGEFKVFDI